jgi:mevalonate kinase
MRFFARGKLLLTAEYAVLGGAHALAVPTRLGQSMNVTPLDQARIEWKSLDEQGTVWHKNTFDKHTLVPTQNDNISQRLQALLNIISTENPSLWNTSTGFSIETKLDFNRNWGLGSSSTLASLLAQWADVNPYLLQQSVFGGSGYDIACTTASGPIRYALSQGKPKVEDVSFAPPFLDQLYFVYLNQKQDSQREVAAFDQNKLTSKVIMEINQLTDAFLHATTREEFQKVIKTHEHKIGAIIGRQPIGERLFADYSGAVKSLGAWGGDFILACGGNDTRAYFKQKGYATCLAYKDLIADVSLDLGAN